MFSGELATVIFGLASALSWGACDFSGGLASKRAPVFGTLAVSYTVGLLLLIGLALVWGERLPPVADLGWGFAAGLASTVGGAALYRGLAIGQMGVVAPVSAVLTAALPTLFGMFIEGLPGLRTFIGFGLAVAGIWLVAGNGGVTLERSGLGLALLAGCGFGIFFILLHRAGADRVFWPLVASRVGSLVVVLPVAYSQRQRAPKARWPLVLMVITGVLDVAGNTFFVLAGQTGRLDVAAILASLYPASTVLLAALILGERVRRPQAIGIVVALAAIALIAS